MIELAVEKALASIIVAAASPALAGVGIFASRESADVPLPAIVCQVVRSQPLCGSAIETCDVEICLYSHSGDDTQAVHATRWDAAAAAVRAFTFPEVTREGAKFLGKPYFGEAVHGREGDSTWLSTMPLRLMAQPGL